MKTILTLCMIHNDTHILLGKKKRGFGLGKWNGFGGHVEENETIEEAAYREVREEVGVHPRNLKKRGVLHFEVTDHFEPYLEVHVFSASEFEGEVTESEEMEPRWFTHEEIPYAEMWLDDIHWLPLLLQGKRFEGKFYFKDSNTLERGEVREL